MKKALLQWVFVAALVLCQGRLLALSTTMGPYGLGAAGLGAGGAAVATSNGGEALLWNPAAMPTEGWDLGYHGGLGGPAQSLQNDLVVSGPVDEGVYAGLLLGDQTFPQAAGFHEDNVGLGLAAGIGRWFSVGMMQRIVLADPGALRGWSMDAGALAAFPLGGAWRLRLGVAGTDLISSLAWGDGLEEVQPAVTREGLALEAAPGTWLAFEQDQLDRQGNGGSTQWRAGLQFSLLDQQLALRLGATQAELGALYYTAGLGGSVPWTARRLEADYSVLVPSDGSASEGALRHVFSLRWRFEVAKAIGAALRQELKDRQGRVNLARIALAPGPDDVQDWSLEIRDRHGKTVRILQGSGLLPPGVIWDGKDAAGFPVQAAGISYVLRATRASGTLIEHHALLAPAADLGLDNTLAGAEGGFGLRAAATASVVRPKVALKGSGDLAVSSALFDLSGVADAAKATAWEVRIVDAAGKTVRTLHGKGRLPKSVSWEGTDDLGRPVEGSLGSSFEVRVTAPDGRQRIAAAAPVVPESGFADLAERARGRGLQLEASCGSDPATGQPLCVFYFDRDSTRLTDSDLDALAAAAALAEDKGLQEAVIDGHADHEGGRDTTDQLSQERADAVLKALVERGVGLKSVTSRGWADTRPVADSDTDRGRAKNRRVELRFVQTTP